MKYAIFGDFHGTELGDLESALSFENPDLLICTGDFDRTKTIHQFKDLEEKYQKVGKQVVKIPGNHDHAALTGLVINSEAMRMQGKNSYTLHQELMNDSVAKQYIDELVNSRDPGCTNNKVKIFLDEDKFGKGYPTIVIHGAYDGDLSSFPDCPENIRDLWMRLETKNDHRKNFDVMNQKGYKVMIRGHDHGAVYVYNDPNKGIVTHIPKGEGSAYRLFKHRKHTINPGALFEGLFATIVTRVSGEDVPLLKYHKL